MTPHPPSDRPMVAPSAISEPSPRFRQLELESQSWEMPIHNPCPIAWGAQASSSTFAGSAYPATYTTAHAYAHAYEFTQVVDVHSFAGPFGEPFTPTGQETIKELEDGFFTSSPPKPPPQSTNATVVASTAINTANAAQPSLAASQPSQMGPQVSDALNDDFQGDTAGLVTSRNEGTSTKESIPSHKPFLTDEEDASVKASGQDTNASPTPAGMGDVQSIDTRSGQDLIKTTVTSEPAAQSAIYAPRKRARSTTSEEEAHTKRARRPDTPSTEGSEFGSSASDTIVASDASTPLTSQDGDGDLSDSSRGQTPSISTSSQDKGKGRAIEPIQIADDDQAPLSSVPSTHTLLNEITLANFDASRCTTVLGHRRAPPFQFTRADDTWLAADKAKAAVVSRKKTVKNTRALYTPQQGMMTVFPVEPTAPIQPQPVPSGSRPAVVHSAPIATPHQVSPTISRQFKNAFCAMGTYNETSDCYQGPRRCHRAFPATQAGIKDHLAEHGYLVHLERYRGKDFPCPWIGCKGAGRVRPLELVGHIWEAHVRPGASDKVCSNWETCSRAFKSISDEPLCEDCEFLQFHIIAAALGSDTVY